MKTQPFLSRNDMLSFSFMADCTAHFFFFSVLGIKYRFTIKLHLWIFCLFWERFLLMIKLLRLSSTCHPLESASQGAGNIKDHTESIKTVLYLLIQWWTSVIYCPALTMYPCIHIMWWSELFGDYTQERYSWIMWNFYL